MILQSVLRRRQRAATLRFALLSAVATACAPRHAPQHVGWNDAELSMERECQRGMISACGELGRSLLKRSQADTHERERALVLLELACGREDRYACTALGMYYLTDNRGQDSQARARDLLKRMCEQDQAEACWGMAAARRIEDPSDRRESRALLEKACQLGDGRGCESLAMAQLRDDFSGSRAQAMQALAAACAQGLRSSCFRLAQLQLADPATQQEGMRRLIANCEQGHNASCVLAAISSAPLLVERPNCANAAKYAQRACAAKDEDGCTLVEACRSTPPIDGTRAQRLERACERRSSLACLYWADLQQHTQSSPVELPRIRTAYVIACQGLREVSPVACVRSAIMDLDAAKESTEAEKLIELLRTSCERRSSGEACNYLGEAYRAGKVVAPDKNRAAEFLRRACDLGRRESCGALF